MIRTKRYFDRGDYVLEVDTTSGQRLTRMIPKISTAEAKIQVEAGRMKVAHSSHANQPKRPGPVRRAMNYSKAKVKHVAAGSPKASLATIQERFAICQKCPSNLYKPLDEKAIPEPLKHLDEVGTCLHSGCGCFLHPTEIEPAKLAWADQVCPNGHWGKAVNV